MLLLLLCCLGLCCALPPPCDSSIYCHGNLLHTVQMNRLFRDSKTFVDMKMKYSVNETWEEFNALMDRTEHEPSKEQLRSFVNKMFDPEGSEFETWDPSDWVQHPSFLKKISDPDLQNWGSHLNMLWKELGKKMKDDVKENPEHYSIIYVPYPVIVPGGRFREFYYWDSYWIVRGLLYSEMYHTVKGMLKNFLSIVETVGFIPNGGRVYYKMRSQPPLLIPMVDSYLEFTKDYTFLNESIHIMEKEFLFWMTNRTVEVEKDGKLYTLARFIDSSSGPRPESYGEDVETASESFHTKEEKEAYYAELKTAAESGWDFSSRWFIVNGTNKGSLINLKGRSIIPVDLNAIIYWNAKLLSKFHHHLGNTEKASNYSNIADQWLESVNEILWHGEIGSWLDYDILNEAKRDYFYPSNISPLWTGCWDPKKQDVGKILKYLEKSQISTFLGGITTSFSHSGEQWDYPNAWPPLQYIMIIGLDSTDDEWAKRLAYELTVKWVRSNYLAFNKTGIMYEKYDATKPGYRGSGGEYETQSGFGWTNGVIIELLEKYGNRLTAADEFTMDTIPVATSLAKSAQAQYLTVILMIVATLATGCIGFVVYRRLTQGTRTTASTSNKRGLCPKLCGGYMELRNMNFD